MNIYIDICAKSLNKYGEELCGDKYEYCRGKDGIIAVLSDGLGSGVKANILATLTSKIAITMLKEGIEIHEVVDTIANTLPVCNIRKLAYSTFSIVKIDNFGNGYLAEFDTPSAFFIRNGKIISNKYEIVEINNRVIREYRFKVLKGDIIVMVSDGVIHAGAGKTINLGWKWENVAEFLKVNNDAGSSSAKTITGNLIGACRDLYLEMPGDDTTVISLSAGNPSYGVLFSGPPENTKKDKEVVNELFGNYDKKIVCGGTAANIVSRETGKKIETNFEVYDFRVPPYAKIEGVDLVTEGVLTLKVTIEKLNSIAEGKEPEIENDGASKLAQMLSEQCSHIKFLVGKAINPAHQNPYFPQELSIKLNVLYELKNILEKLGKVVEIEYY